MRVRFEAVAVLAAIVAAAVSMIAFATNYYHPHIRLESHGISIFVFIAIFAVVDAIIAALCTWLVFRLIGRGLRVVRASGRAGGSSIVISVASLLLIGPAALIAAVAAGGGDEFLLQNSRLILAYVGAIAGSVVLWGLGSILQRRREQSWGATSTIRSKRVALAAGFLLVAYPWLLISTGGRVSPEEKQLSEAVFKAARTGHTEIRLADHVDTNTKFACLIHDFHTRDDIEKSIGVRYSGYLHGGSDMYQLVLIDADGTGRAVQFIAGSVDLREGDPLCAYAKAARIRLNVRPWHDTLSISAKLVDE